MTKSSTHNLNANTQKSLRIDLQPLPRGERQAFVENVCAILIESRFGHPYSFFVKPQNADKPRSAIVSEDTMTAYSSGFIRYCVPADLDADVMGNDRPAIQNLRHSGLSNPTISLGRSSRQFPGPGP